MADVPQRNYGRLGNMLHADTRRAIADVEGQVDAFTPDDPSQWADPPPTSVREAINRLAKAGATGTWPA